MRSFAGNPSSRRSSAPPAAASPASFANYQFDFGIGPSPSPASRPLRGQAPSPSPSPLAGSAPHRPAPRAQWTHQPAAGSTAAGLANPPTSMVGDISGKSWAAPPPASSSSRIGIPVSNPNLFNDLLGGFRQDKSSSASASAAPLNSFPLKGSSFSMGNLSDSLPRPSAPIPGSGQPMKFSSMSGAPMKGMNDPFASLADLGKKPTANLASNNFDTFKKTAAPEQSSIPKPTSVDDSFSMFFSSTPSRAPAPEVPDANDWDTGLGLEFGGSTTELEGLPPPPLGVTAPAAKSKGLDNYKQGQYADAIKWLSWAVLLLEKSGDNATTVEALSCRASCFKEVGEYKKAVADCSKVLELDGENVAVLLQRALLYESTEKYKLGTEDLRMVLKIDPGNRLARSTIHRMSKFAY